QLPTDNSNQCRVETHETKLYSSLSQRKGRRKVMSVLPKEIKLTLHAQQRLSERRGAEKYNTKNLMKSSCRWYGKDDLIPESSLYIHCLYVCRKARNKMGYLTDGNIEILYDKNANAA